MRTVEATVTMDAPPCVVWDVLVHGEDYARWNPFITEASGPLAEGARPQLRIAPPGTRAMSFRPLILEASPGVRLRWIGKLGLPGLCDAEHEFLLNPAKEGGTKLIQRESFRGILVPFLAGALEPTRQGFEAMNAALCERVEAKAGRR